MPGTRATLVGSVAILMWSLLALFTVATGTIPPFQLNAMAFAVGGCAGLIWAAARGRLAAVIQPWPAMLFGTVGLFGYHALYFTALRNAPPAEAGLIAYLWPLLIVLFSALLPGERLKPHHLGGAVLGLLGTGMILADRGGTLSGAGSVLGYAAAAGCAITWSAYSVLSRRLKAIPTEGVVGFCLLTAALSLPAHLATETTVWPDNGLAWLAVGALGLFPVGLAFYAWDHGVKHGDIQVLGAASYAAPLISTGILLAAGYAAPSVTLAVAALAITGGAVIASWDLIAARTRAA